MVDSKNKKTKKVKNPHVWPELPFKELMCAIVVMVVLIVWALLMDAPLGEIATPSRTENPAKAPWYFIGLQEILVYFDPWYSGVILPSIIMVGLMAIPYLDNNPKGAGEYNFGARKFAIMHFCFGYALWMGMIVVGQFMRGPSWMFFWPWEPWDDSHHGTDVIMTDLDNFTGVICLVIYSALFFVIPKLMKWKVVQKLDNIRYTILMTLMLLMYAVPIKVVLRQIFHIKYVVVTPWFNI